MVCRVGNGGAALTSAATPAFLDEYTTSGAFVRTLALPTAAAGANKMITAAGTSTSEGFLTRSTDKKYLMVTGYDAAVGTAAVATTSGATFNRVVGRIDVNSNIDATTALPDYATGGNPRSAFSTNGTAIWVGGSTGGVRYTTLGATTSTQLSTTSTNIRVVNIFDGQLYISSGGGTIRVATVGTGTPTTAGEVITNLPGTPATGSPYGFFFADLSPAVSGVDVLYVADDAAGIIKYSLVGGTWTSNGTVAGLSRGLTGIISGNSVTLFATSATSTLTSITDVSGYNAAFTGSQTTLATAATNTAFRGVALAPEAGVLPIKLDYLKGQKANIGNNLNWKVTCLSTNIVMEVERSANTSNFKSVTYIAATQARCAQPFDFTDMQPLPGKNFYRIKMVDADSKISYSPIVVIINGNIGIEFVGLYPSVVKGETKLSVSSAKTTSIETKITSISGKLFQAYKQNIPSGSSFITIDCGQLAPGIYNITATAADATTKTIRFVKQ